MLASISLACDMSIIGEDATFQNPARELGLAPKGGFTWFLYQMLGRLKTMELMLADTSIPAAKAVDLGLATRCVLVENLEGEALSIAKRLEALPRTSLRTAKRLVSNAASKEFPDFLEYENHELIRSLAPGKMDMLNFGR